MVCVLVQYLDSQHRKLVTYAVMCFLCSAFNVSVMGSRIEGVNTATVVLQDQGTSEQQRTLQVCPWFIIILFINPAKITSK